jgi:hypothetical protein
VQEHVATNHFKGHNSEVCYLSPRFNDISPISATMDDVKIWTRTVGQTERPGAFVYRSNPSYFLYRLCDVVAECWKLKAKLDPPSMLNRRQEVVVTSVNWEDRDAATQVSRVLVSYRWHGIVYVSEFSSMLSFTISSVRCWDLNKMAILRHWPMDEWYAQRNSGRPADMIVHDTLITVEPFLYLRTASLQPHLGCQSTRCMN